MADHDEDNFEKGDSGASYTYPSQAGSLKKGGFALLKGFPCKISEITTSKAGKHGHAKASIVGNDIFTDKKYEDCCPTSHNMEVPNVVKTEQSLIDINPDGFMTLMGDDGSTKEDLKLPLDETLNSEIRNAFDAGKNVVVIIISAMGKEQVVQWREDTTSM